MNRRAFSNSRAIAFYLYTSKLPTVDGWWGGTHVNLSIVVREVAGSVLGCGGFSYFFATPTLSSVRSISPSITIQGQLLTQASVIQ